MNIKYYSWCLAVCAGTLLAGCTPEPKPVSPENATAEQKLQAIFTGFCEGSSALRKSPETDAELMPFLERFGPPAEIMRSPRDNQPFVVNYKGQGASSIFAYERAGVEGKRVAINGRGDITSLSEASFKKLQQAPNSVKAEEAKDDPAQKMRDAMQGKGIPNQASD